MNLSGLSASLVLRLDDEGEVEAMQVGYSWRSQFENVDIPPDFPKEKIPKYLQERIALVKLTPVNRVGSDRGVIGRKLSDSLYVVYLTYDEFKELKQLTQGESK